MDSRGAVDAGVCNGKKPHADVLESKEEEDSITEVLLPPAPKRRGGMKGKRARSFAKRKVQWNDRNGDDLVHILEFQPSDSSDSEDDCSCTVWTRGHKIVTCVQICCCLGRRRSSS